MFRDKKQSFQQIKEEKTNFLKFKDEKLIKFRTKIIFDPIVYYYRSISYGYAICDI